MPLKVKAGETPSKTTERHATPVLDSSLGIISWNAYGKPVNCREIHFRYLLPETLAFKKLIVKARHTLLKILSE